MKKTVLFAVALVCALNVNALVSLKLAANSDGTGDVTIAPGSTVTAYIYADLDDNFAGAQYDMYLPAGITMTKAVAGSMIKDEDGELTHSFSKKEYSNYVRFLIYSVDNTFFSPWHADMVKVTLQASSYFTGGSGAFRNIVFSRPMQQSDEISQIPFNIYQMTIPATSITLNNNSAMLNIGDFITLSATVAPAEASQSVTWKSSNTNVAEVSASGLVTAKAAGYAKITATTTDGTNLSANCDITVLGPNIPDTDISTYGNILYIANQDAYTGSQVVLPISMKNNAYIVGFQCDLVLPDGVTVVAENGEYQIELAETRTTNRKHSLSFNKLSDGSFRLVCVSLNNAYFSGNNGDVVYVKVNIAKGMAEGTYPMYLKNIETTTATGTLYDVDLCKSTLNVIERIMGDVNKDKKVSVADAACTVSIILGTKLPTWDIPAADMNNDGVTSVADVASIVNLILSGGNAAKGEDLMNYSNPEVSLNQNGNTLALGVNGNANEYIAMQFDVKTNARINDILPTLRSEKHIMTFAEVSAGVYRVVVYSAGNEAFSGISGDVVNIVLSSINGNVEINNIELVRADLSTAYPEGVAMNPTGINDINGQQSTINSMYNLAGQKVGANYKGVKIINGKKVLDK